MTTLIELSSGFVNVMTFSLGPSIPRLVTDGNTKDIFCGFILSLFQIATAIKLDFLHYPIRCHITVASALEYELFTL